jgi:hypothetical protein
MTATLSHFISAPDFIKLMRAQDASGKHGHHYSPTATDWRQVADYISRNTHTGLPFVLVRDLPIKWLQYEHMPDRPELVQKYAQQSPAFPPIYVTFSNHAASQGPLARPLIKNGNHRVAAALCRGQDTINAIMPQEAWQNIQDNNFHLFHRPAKPSHYNSNPHYRRNADEKIQALYRQWMVSGSPRDEALYIRARERIGYMLCDWCSNTTKGGKTCSLNSSGDMECSGHHCEECLAFPGSREYITCAVCDKAACDSMHGQERHPFDTWPHCQRCGIYVCSECQISLDPDLIISHCQACNMNICTKFIPNHDSCSHHYFDHQDTTGYGDHPRFYCKVNDQGPGY